MPDPVSARRDQLSWRHEGHDCPRPTLDAARRRLGVARRPRRDAAELLVARRDLQQTRDGGRLHVATMLDTWSLGPPAVDPCLRDRGEDSVGAWTTNVAALALLRRSPSKSVPRSSSQTSILVPPKKTAVLDGAMLCELDSDGSDDLTSAGLRALGDRTISDRRNPDTAFGDRVAPEVVRAHALCRGWRPHAGPHQTTIYHRKTAL